MNVNIHSLCTWRDIIEALEKKELFNSKDTLFIIALLIIDDTDNTDFFLFKFNLSNLEKKRILFLKNHFIRLNDKSFFSEYNLLKIWKPSLIFSLSCLLQLVKIESATISFGMITSVF